MPRVFVDTSALFPFSVTWDRLGFPVEDLAALGVRVVDPDTYLCELFAELPSDIAATLETGQPQALPAAPPLSYLSRTENTAAVPSSVMDGGDEPPEPVSLRESASAGDITEPMLQVPTSQTRRRRRWAAPWPKPWKRKPKATAGGT